jgi:hypothetical protein
VIPGKNPGNSPLAVTAAACTVTGRFVSSSMLVMATPAMPQGVICRNGARSPQTLSANPCIETQCRTPTPIEAILRSTTHVPVRHSRLRATTPNLAHTAISNSSIARR